MWCSEHFLTLAECHGGISLVYHLGRFWSPQGVVNSFSHSKEDYRLHWLWRLNVSKTWFDFRASLILQGFLMRGFSVWPAMQDLSHRWSGCRNQDTHPTFIPSASLAPSLWQKYTTTTTTMFFFTFIVLWCPKIDATVVIAHIRGCMLQFLLYTNPIAEYEWTNGRNLSIALTGDECVIPSSMEKVQMNTFTSWNITFPGLQQTKYEAKGKLNLKVD